MAFLVYLFVFFLFFFSLPKNWMKIAIVILGNAFFYVYAGGISPLLIVFVSSLILYAVSRGMEREYSIAEQIKPVELSPKQEVEFWKPYKKRCRTWVWIGIGLLFSVFIYVKLGKLFGWENVENISQLRFRTVLVPLGLSYYTFSSAGYLIDIYKRKVKCEHNFFILLAAITFFPIIVEGPISKIESLGRQFRNIPQFEYKRFCFGMQRMLYGLFKKLVVADRIMPVTTAVFSNVFDYAGVELVIAVVLNMFAFYADFSGCMDIVIGAGEAMGIVLDENFKQPFLATNIADFWRRWHITLFSWFRDYIYMPIAKASWFKKINKSLKKKLGKESGQTFSMAIPTMTVWILTGLWHGTGKDYIAWGIYWGILTIMSQIFQPYAKKINRNLKFRTKTFGWRLFRILRTDFLYAAGSLLIVSGTAYGLHGCIYILRQIFQTSRVTELFNGGIYSHGMDQGSFIITVMGIILIMIVDCQKDKGMEIRETIFRQPLLFRWIIWVLLILCVMVWGQYGPGYSALEFVYRGF